MLANSTVMLLKGCFQRLVKDGGNVNNVNAMSGHKATQASWPIPEGTCRPGNGDASGVRQCTASSRVWEGD